jgi:MFS family permease
LNPLYLLVGQTALGHTAQVGARLATMLYAVHLSASPVTVGVLSALFSVVNVFTSMHVGRWIDRSGARVPMLAGTAMMALGAAVGLWGEVAGLFVVAVVMGSSHNILFIAQQRLAGQYGKPEDRVHNFSMVSLGQSAAGTLGPVLAGYVIEHAGFPVTFMALCAIAAVPFAVLLFNVMVFPPPEPRRERGRGTGTLQLLKKDTQLRRMNAISVLTSSTWSIVTFLIPLYGLEIGLAASTIGLIIGSFSLATVGVRLVLSKLSRRFTHWQLLIASLVITGSGFAGIPSVTGVVALVVLAAWIGIGLGLCGPISTAILYDISPPDRIGELLGLRVTMLNVSHSTVPILSGALGTAIGIAPVFWLVAACLFSGGWVIREEWSRPRARKEAVRSSA